MPDPNDPNAQTPPDPAMDPAAEVEPLTPEQEATAADRATDPANAEREAPHLEFRKEGCDAAGCDEKSTTDDAKSSIQGAMEDALDRSLAAAQETGDIPLRTYPISAKMRARLLNEFTYHAPREDQIPRYAALRSMALTFATMVVELTPASREQSLALTKLSEAIMHANAAIVRDEEVSSSAEADARFAELHGPRHVHPLRGSR